MSMSGLQVFDTQATPTSAGATIQRDVFAATYGARGDGLTDSTAAINAALLACALLGGGTVRLPAGTVVISGTLVPTASYVALAGAGLLATRVQWSANTAMAATGMYACLDVWNQIGNDIFDLSFDVNAQNGVTVGTQSIVYPGSRAVVQRVGVVNRTGSVGAGVGTVGILVTGHDTTVKDCWVHHDYIPAQTTTTGAITNGAGVVVNLTSSSGFVNTGVTQKQLVVIDPPVNAMLGAATLAGAATFTPVTDRDNPWPNGGLTTGMIGIVPGQALVFDTGGNQETLTVLAVFNDHFTTTAGAAHAHSAYSSITYTPAQTQAPLNVPATESCKVTAVGVNTITISPQQNHPSGVAVVAMATVLDGIGCTTPDSLRTVRGFDATNNRCEFLALDGVGFAAQLALSTDGSITRNKIYRCPSGITITNVSSVVIEANDVDLTWFGIMPNDTQFAGVWFLNAATPANATYTDHVIASNVLKGGAYNIVNFSPGGIKNGRQQITGNICDSAGLNGIYTVGIQASGIANNTVVNPNSQNAASQPGLGVDLAAIFVQGTAANSAADLVGINGNQMIDTRGTPLMQAAVMCYGGFVTRVTARGNNVEGLVASKLAFQGGGGGGAGFMAPENLCPLGVLTYAATMNVPGVMDQYEVTTVNATGNATFNAGNTGQPGQKMTLTIINDATSAKTITFGTNFRAATTLIGTASKAATIGFMSDGTAWFETSRALVL